MSRKQRPGSGPGNVLREDEPGLASLAHDVALPKPCLTKLRHARRLLEKPVNKAESSADSSAVRRSPEMASQLTLILSVEAVTKEKKSFLLNFIGSLKKSINQARVFSLVTTP